MDKGEDDDDLAGKRISLRITVVGAGGSGKTNLITQFVNHVFQDRHHPTTFYNLYYATLSLPANEDDPTGPKLHNFLIEIEDTPCCRHGIKDMSNMYSFWWPKTEDEAMSRIAKDAIDPKTRKRSSVNLPFSMVNAPVGHHNDDDFKVYMDTETHPGKHFCGKKDASKRWDGKSCDPKTRRGSLVETERTDFGHQCESCVRFDMNTSSIGLHREYRPLVRSRMAYLFVFDATKQASYIEALRRLQEFQEFHAMRRSKRPTVAYLVGNKSDQQYRSDDPDTNEKNDFAGIQDHLDTFIREQSEAGNNVCKAFVSAAHYKGVAKLFRDVVMDLRMRESLWKLDSQGEKETAAAEHKCALQ